MQAATAGYAMHSSAVCNCSDAKDRALPTSSCGAARFKALICVFFVISAGFKSHASGYVASICGVWIYRVDCGVLVLADGFIREFLNTVNHSGGECC
jgi:hypothetical protein